MKPEKSMDNQNADVEVSVEGELEEAIDVILDEYFCDITTHVLEEAERLRGELLSLFEAEGAKGAESKEDEDDITSEEDQQEDG